MNMTHDIYMEIIAPIVMSMERPYVEEEQENLVYQEVLEIVRDFPDRERLSFVLWFDFSYGYEVIGKTLHTMTDEVDGERTHTTGQNWFRSAKVMLRKELKDRHGYVWEEVDHE